MLSVCAWCGEEIGNTVFERELVSHGICDKCKSNMEFQYGGTLEKFLETLAARVLVVDGEGNVLMANKQALSMLEKTPKQVCGLKGGIVFECAYSRLPGGCGNSVHCSGCTIRNTVMGTLKTGVAVNKSPARLHKETAGGATSIDMLISTMKSGKFVLLKIDEIITEKKDKE